MDKAAEVGRKRAFVSEESATSVDFKTRRLAVAVAVTTEDLDSTCESIGDFCCSSNGLNNELAKDSLGFADLETTNEAMVKFLATTAGQSVDFTERRDSTEMQSPPSMSICRRAVKMPTEAELEDFFAAAEKSLQKQFLDKYNYDIVKDEPKEGRYEWVQIQIKPRPSVTMMKKKKTSTV